jgi:hypothetical protein
MTSTPGNPTGLRDAIVADAIARYDAHVTRLFAPARTVPDAVQAIVDRCVADEPDPPPTTPAAKRLWQARTAARAWEALIASGMLPVSWASDPSRCFAGWTATEVVGADGTASFRPASSLFSPVPLEPETALALACDPSGVLTVEALAREWCSRVALWTSTVRADAPVRWRFEASRPAYVYRPELANIERPMERALGLEDPDFDPYADGSPPLIWFAGPAYQARLWPDGAYRPMIWEEELLTFCLLSAMWSRCVDHDALVPDLSGGSRPRATVPRVAGRQYAALPDPFAPFIDALDRGYAIGFVNREAIDVYGIVPTGA